MNLWRVLAVFLLVGGTLLSMQRFQGQQSADMVEAAKALLASASADELAKLKQPFETEKRVIWHFIPLETRNGLPLMQMKPDQQKLAMKLLESALSQVGFEKASTIMQLESVLRQLEGPTSHQRRNPEKYYFEIFGDVGPSSHWGLSVEGHHLSVNFVMRGNKVVDSTPQFFASNPAELKADYGAKFPKGLRVLSAEEERAFELLASLQEGERKQAMIAGPTPKEIRAAGDPQPPAHEKVGIEASKLNADQREKLRKLMLVYTDKARTEVAAERWKLIEEAGFGKISFAWSGADKPGVGHYYRVQGPTFLIEFINVQPDAAGNPANHIHSVWRDMLGDFDLQIAAK